MVEVVIDVIDHGRKRGGLARTGRARDQHQAARKLGYLAEHLGSFQILQGQNGTGYGAKHGARAPRLLKGVDPKTRHAGYLEGEVHLEILLQLLALIVVHDVVDQGVHFTVIQGGQIDLANLSINPDHRGNPG
ncbi:hypothetical protein D3C72_1997440 [compost metagenome]